MTFQIITWIAAALSIIGAMLNVWKRVEGFYFWIVANIIWIFINLYKGIHAQAFLFLFFSGISAYGVYKWKKEGKI